MLSEARPQEEVKKREQIETTFGRRRDVLFKMLHDDS